MSSPSLVLVVLDTARKDFVHSKTAPVFAALARSGRSFARAVAPAPWTLPSHASVFSGLTPTEHGITGAAVMTPEGPRSPRERIESLAVRWLPEVLRRRGLATFAASANPWVSDAVGLTFGFESVEESWRFASLPKLANPLDAGPGAGLAHRLGVYARRTAGIGDGGAQHSLDSFKRFLAAGRRPFFAFFNVMEPHAPYAPPRGHNPLDLADRLRGVRAVRRWSADRMVAFSVGRQEIDPSELSFLRELYGGEISYSDAWVGRLLEVLEGGGLLGETVVIVTSDHGENLGEHHRLSHVMSMHETLLSVPLVMSGPLIPKGVEESPISLASLPEILTSLTEERWSDPSGRPVLAEYESAAAQVSGARRLEEQAGTITSETRERLRAKWVAAYEGDYKYVASSVGDERLFELSSDPGESHDVSGEHPGIVARLRGLRSGWAGDGDVPGTVLEREIADHLEQLGYL
ncbi:MAG: sulfatase-like hydrolase/transferase [Actinomycetota bacterium]